MKSIHLGRCALAATRHNSSNQRLPDVRFIEQASLSGRLDIVFGDVDPRTLDQPRCSTAPLNQYRESPCHAAVWQCFRWTQVGSPSASAMCNAATKSDPLTKVKLFPGSLGVSASRAIMMDAQDHGKRVISSAEFFENLTEGLPVVVGASAKAGRGMYAAEEIEAGELIQDAAPIVAHPTLKNLDKCCYLCLKYTQESQRHFLDSVNGTTTSGAGPSFCSRECALYSEDQFYGVESRADWSKLREHCRTYGLRFPLLVARLACMVVSGSVEPDVLKSLCFVKTDSAYPPQWAEEHTVIHEALNESGQPEEALTFLTLNWYISVIARMHLNSFQVDIVRPLDPSDLLAAASDAADGHGSAGSAVYLLPSMYNHSCEPNVDVFWPRDAIARFEARRDIQKGEELTITYVDASNPRETRQKHLEWAYGFQCQCQKCLEENEPSHQEPNSF